MQACDTRDSWTDFLTYAKKHCSAAAFGNWFAPIKVIEATDEEITLEIPNVFVQEYILSNYAQELRSFLPVRANGELAVRFVIAKKDAKPQEKSESEERRPAPAKADFQVKLNGNYRFESFIEGPNNQFVKSAAFGVASRPGQSYNPLFIHGGVGLGKTHILHGIGHHIAEHSPNLVVQCITTEAFINDLVDSLRNKSIERMKRFYRSNVDVLLVDDIQFLQSRPNFEEEFCSTFETLINQNKQVVITSDKPPSQLNLSERLIARMEWGLVAHLDVPDLETRVAILQHKAELKGLSIPSQVAFFIAEHIHSNIRQLEGAVNRLSAHYRLLHTEITEEMVERTLREMIQTPQKDRISVEEILKGVAAIFQVRVTELKGYSRAKEIVVPRQVAMYLAKEMIHESLIMLGAAFGKTHSTILHAHKSIEKRLADDEILRRQIGMVRRNIGHKGA
ncbi:MAG: chromosomal replication initiator protein DnaA [Chlamydiales bacterium]|nr:chromosomal replication initiator protein DnaA [Chlamydiales bacterium]